MDVAGYDRQSIAAPVVETNTHPDEENEQGKTERIACVREYIVHLGSAIRCNCPTAMCDVCIDAFSGLTDRANERRQRRGGVSC